MCSRRTPIREQDHDERSLRFGVVELSVAGRSLPRFLFAKAVAFGELLPPLARGIGLSTGDPHRHQVAPDGGTIGPFVGEVARTSTVMGALDHPLHPCRAPVPARGIPLARGASTHRSGHRIGWVKHP